MLQCPPARLRYLTYRAFVRGCLLESKTIKIQIKFI